MKINWLRIFKISIGCCAAVLLAEMLHLKSSTSAGIIALLSIQNTKRETFSIAYKRILAFFVAVASAFIVFSIFGFHVAAFGLFLFLFTFCCYSWRLDVGISMNTVLMTHLWAAKEIRFPLVLNEFILLIIGISIAVLVNLYMPKITDEIRKDQKKIDSTMKELLLQMANALLKDEKAGWKQEFTQLKNYLNEALARAYANRDNTLAVDMHYYIDYVELRIRQCAFLEQISDNIKRLQTVPRQAGELSQFMRTIAESFHRHNNANELLSALFALRSQYKKSELPQSREEFESRAVLYQIVSDLEHILLLKKEFAEHLSEWQIRYFWKQQAK